MNQDAPPQTATGFWSIERFVAFLLGPLVVAGAGWLSTFLAKEIGIPIASETIVGVFGVGALGAAGLAYKWLHGRQLEMALKHNVLVAQIEADPMAEGFLKTTMHDLEGLAQSVVQKAIDAIPHTATPKPQPVRADLPPPPAPLPSGQGLATADAGAASEA